MIVIINGPCGIGKTTISEALCIRFDRAVMLDGDYIGAVRPFEIYDEARIDYLYRTLQHLISFHINEGHYHYFVINYVFESPESLADLRQRLAKYDDEIYAFRLIASDAAIEERIIKREGADGEDVAWYLNRYKELVKIQERAALVGDMGFEIDTTHYTAAQTADVIWNNIHERIALVPYNPRWKDVYAAEHALIAGVLGDTIQGIHHIGSTSVSGLSAKPVIDIMVVVRSFDAAACLIAPLRALGYRYINYPQNIDRWFFRKGVPRTHHIHLVEEGSQTMRDQLDFRDALRAQTGVRRAYAQLKESLAKRYKNERAKYADSKGVFVARTLKDWRMRCVLS